jgi:Fic family protein
MQAHVAACEAAGPRVCIVTNSSINNQSDDYTNAYLSLRAIPSWIETFQAGLDAEVDAANGAITQRNKQSVDLTRQILDTDARLSAKITLKGRLEDLLATREGDLGELLQVERELARVTGEIESITSNLKALRLRVSMSDMTVNYTTKRSLVAGGRANPLASAFGDFFYNMAEAFAAVITFFAVGLPWMILIAIFLFIWLRGIWPWVRRKRNKT